jgi:hypothetical protein
MDGDAFLTKSGAGGRWSVAKFVANRCHTPKWHG